jgi:cell wall-associated NlpC family hydrolase
VTGQTATGGSVRERPRAFISGSRTGWAPIVVLAAACAAWLLLAVGPASGQTITSKRQQAEAIMAQVESMQGDLEQAGNAYYSANVQLRGIEHELDSNAKHLVAAKRSLGVAQNRIAVRLRDLYINGQGDSTLEVILGSSSLDEIIARLDAVERVSKQDAQILRTVKQFRKEVETRRANLQDAHSRQVQVVAERAAEQQKIQSQIAEQNTLLASVKDEIVKMQAEEARRQAALAAQARARAQAAAQLAQQAQQDAASQPVYDQSFDTPTYDVPAARYGQVVGVALQYLGVPYVWGGSSPATGFDCSGFVAYVYAQIGVYLPHHAASQYGYGTPVSRDQLAPGDLVFFDGLGHVGIYIGGGQFVHAPHTGDVVKISSLYESWYASTFYGARRL